MTQNLVLNEEPTQYFLSPLLQCVMDRVTGKPTDQLSPLAQRWVESLGSFSTTVSGVIAGRDKTVFTAITDSLHRANTLAPTNDHKVYLPVQFASQWQENIFEAARQGQVNPHCACAPRVNEVL